MRVFFNERVVEFLHYHPLLHTDSDFIKEFTTTENLFRHWMQFIHNEQYRRFLVVDSSVQAIAPPFLALNDNRLPVSHSTSFNSFLSLFKYISASGGLVRNPQGEWLFIYRLGRWDLPKGKIEKKDYQNGSSNAISKAAIREVEEETGLANIQIIRQLPSTWHIFDKKEKNCIKQTFWFEMEVTGTQILKPQTEEGIYKAEWVNKERLTEVIANTYRSLREFLQNVLP